MSRPNLTIIVGPSASGKSTLLNQMKDLGYGTVVSYTTRPMRDGEVDGRDYRFVSVEKFKSHIYRGHITLERTFRIVTGEEYHYGVPVDDLRSAFRDNKHKAMILDLQGVRQLIRQGYSPYIVMVDAPLHELAHRAMKRNSDVSETLDRIAREDREFDQFRRDGLVDMYVSTVAPELRMAKDKISTMEYVDYSGIREGSSK